MKKIIVVIAIILVIVVFVGAVIFRVFKEIKLNSKNVSTTIQSVCEDGSQVREIPIKSCSGEGTLYLYENDDPFGPIETTFEVNYNQLLIFASANVQLEVRVNGTPVEIETLSFTDGRVRILRSVEPGSTVCIYGPDEYNARAVQGFISQDSNRPVYDINTFQFVYNDAQSNEMFLIPGEYSYVFFDKYTTRKLGGEPDTRELSVKVEGIDGVVVDRTYTQPVPEGTQGAVVGDYTITNQGNYTLSIDTEDSIYWTFVKCPICGNEQLEEGEQCDEGDDNGNECDPPYNGECSYCSENCENIIQPGLFCGDSTINGNEQCDEGEDNGNVCIPEYGETCTYCSENCENITKSGLFCGNGTVDDGEECDDGNVIEGDGCDFDCTMPNSCNETCISDIGCEEGLVCYQDSCRNSSCQSETNCICSLCGDGTINVGEECDDGNNVNGDDCSSSCMIEENSEEPTNDNCDGSIGNYVWKDSNGNGVQDKTETGLSKIHMKLTWAGPDDRFGNSDDEVFRDKTNSKGRYEFKALCKGEYRVRVKDTDVENYVQTYDSDDKKNNKTNVELKNNHDKHTKADFGYRSPTIAPATGANLFIILLISAVLTTMIFVGTILVRKLR